MLQACEQQDVLFNGRVDLCLCLGCGGGLALLLRCFRRIFLLILITTKQ
jgi:hypothetical protein